MKKLYKQITRSFFSCFLYFLLAPIAIALPNAQDDLQCVQALTRLKAGFQEQIMSANQRFELNANLDRIREEIREQSIHIESIDDVLWGYEWVDQLLAIDSSFFDYWQGQKKLFTKTSFLVRRNILLRYLRYRQHRDEFLEEIFYNAPGFLQVAELQTEGISELHIRNLSLFSHAIRPHLQPTSPDTTRLYLDSSTRNAPSNFIDSAFIRSKRRSNVDRVEIFRPLLFSALHFHEETPVSMLSTAALEQGQSHRSDWKAWKHFEFTPKYLQALSQTELKNLEKMAQLFSKLKVGGSSGKPSFDAWFVAEALFNSNGVFVTADKGIFYPFDHLLKNPQELNALNEGGIFKMKLVRKPTITMAPPAAAEIHQISIKLKNSETEQVYDLDIALVTSTRIH